MQLARSSTHPVIPGLRPHQIPKSHLKCPGCNKGPAVSKGLTHRCCRHHQARVSFSMDLERSTNNCPTASPEGFPSRRR